MLLPQTLLLRQYCRDNQPPLLDGALLLAFVDVTFVALLAVLLFLEAAAYVGLAAEVLEAAHDSDGNGLRLRFAKRTQFLLVPFRVATELNATLSLVQRTRIVIWSPQHVYRRFC